MRRVCFGLALLATACSSGASPAPAAESHDGAGTSPSSLVTYDTQGYRMNALTRGTLRFENRDGALCSYVGGTAVLWPARFSADGAALRDSTGRTVAVAGEGLSIGGGFRGPGASNVCSSAGDIWLASGEVVERHQP